MTIQDGTGIWYKIARVQVHLKSTSLFLMYFPDFNLVVITTRLESCLIMKLPVAELVEASAVETPEVWNVNSSFIRI